ncbi:YegS/Rv2252/BmrU family lipid kinase OS=Ureibacillus acetophenoni OX=614649 GN=SAMN05877842_102557 PE=3 SV=1 [Ureibacillus acetophenoni]
MEVHFIINEKAGNGKGKKVWNKFKDQLTIPFFEHFTQYSGHALQLAHSITHKLVEENREGLLIAIGGDGTIHEIINGITMPSNIYVGYVKAGSGNDYSRAYHTFVSAYEIEQFVQNPIGIKMDCGQMFYNNNESKKFVNNAGVGFDAFVARKVNGSKTKKYFNKIGLGKLSYGFATIVALFKFKRFDVEVIVDGKQYKFRKSWFVTVSNQPYFGGGMKLTPKSKANDQQLEITIVHNLSHMKLLFLFMTVFTGSHTSLPQVTQLKGTEFQVQVTDPLYLHADGEIIGLTTEQNNTITYKILNESWTSVNLNINSTQNDKF